MKVLIFAYNTDPKLFSTIHSQCNLESLTKHGVTHAWKNFFESLPYHKVFYYKKDFRRAHPEFEHTPLPSILLKEEDRTKILLDASELNIVSDIDELIGLLGKKLSGF